MMTENTIPSGFGGGLTRFNEEYNSKFKMSPTFVIILICIVIFGWALLRILFPIK
jgi:preprotein translocase subunit Sec61beta